MVFDSADPDFFFPHVDLTQVPEYTAEAPKAGGRAMPSRGLLFRKLSEIPAATIAKLRGRARGAGSEFLLACDMRFAGAALRDVIRSPVDDMECAEGLETVLRDLRAQCAVQPDICWGDRFGVVLWSPDGSGQGVPPHPDGTAAELLMHLADGGGTVARRGIGGLATVPDAPGHASAVGGCPHGHGGVGMPEEGTTVAWIGELETH
ncbi:hypothetical protein ACWHA1_39465 [Streptomyces decoyicus]